MRDKGPCPGAVRCVARLRPSRRPAPCTARPVLLFALCACQTPAWYFHWQTCCRHAGWNPAYSIVSWVWLRVRRCVRDACAAVVQAAAGLQRGAPKADNRAAHRGALEAMQGLVAAAEPLL